MEEKKQPKLIKTFISKGAVIYIYENPSFTENGLSYYTAHLTTDFLLLHQFSGSFSRELEQAVQFVYRFDPEAQEVPNLDMFVLYCVDTSSEVWEVGLEKWKEYKTPVAANAVPVGSYLTPRARQFFMHYKGVEAVENETLVK